MLARAVLVAHRPHAASTCVETRAWCRAQERSGVAVCRVGDQRRGTAHQSLILPQPYKTHGATSQLRFRVPSAPVSMHFLPTASGHAPSVHFQNAVRCFFPPLQIDTL
eukprot:5296321-Pleurochrysis_carterae.AAC.2